MPGMFVRFDYNGKHYVCSIDAYYLRRIVLPDGTVLDTEGWVYDPMPVPMLVTPIPVLRKNISVEQLSNVYGASIANEEP